MSDPRTYRFSPPDRTGWLLGLGGPQVTVLGAAVVVCVLLASAHAPIGVFFVPPAHPIVIRHFGSNKQMFGKIVYGMPGDTVEHRGNTVLVAGRVVSHTKPATRFGEPLVRGSNGVVPQGCYYVGTPHKDGFDSRYAAIGYACSDKIVGVGEPIL